MSPPPAETVIIRPRRLVVVEPILILSAVFGFPQILMTQLYILDSITRSLEQDPSWENASIANSSLDGCSANHSDPAFRFHEQVQASASYFNLVAVVSACIPALFVSPFLGAYSDKAGRRYAILPPIISAFIKTVLTVLVVLLKLPIWVLWVGAALEGMGGYYTTLLSGCFSYIADTTTEKQRRFRITVLEMLMFFSAILGPLGTGKILEMIGYLYSFLITLGGQVLVLVYVIFFVPETIQKDPQAKLLDLDHIKRLGNVFLTKDPNSNRRYKLLCMMAAFFISAISSFDNIDTIYLANHPLCMKPAIIGYFTATYIGVSSLFGLLAAWLFKFCLSDLWVGLLAGVASVGKSLYKAFVQTVLLIFFMPVFGMFSLLYIPTIRTLMSKMVDKTEQGALFGAISFAEIVCSILSALIINPIYSATQGFMTGFSYVVMAILYLLGCAAYTLYIIAQKQDDNKRYDLLIQSHDDDDIQGEDTGHLGDRDVPTDIDSSNTPGNG